MSEESGRTNEQWARAYKAAKRLGPEGTAVLSAALNDRNQLRADLEAARKEIDQWREGCGADHLQWIKQSRATEAELRARVEDARREGLKRGAELAIETLEEQRDKFAAGSEERHYLSQLVDGLRVGLAMALAALDAQEPRT